MPHTLGWFLIFFEYWFRLSINGVVQCSMMMHMSFVPPIKSTFDCLLLVCIVVNPFPPKSLLPLAFAQWVGSRVRVGESKLTKGGLTLSIMLKTPLGGGASGREGHGRKNQGGKGNGKGSMSGKPPRQCGRKMDAHILENIVQAYYEGTPAQVKHMI